MSSGGNPLSVPEELLPVKRPELEIFPQKELSIKWIEIIDDTSSLGPVVLARVSGDELAVKFFKSYDPESERHLWEPFLGEQAPLELAAYCTDPFYRECQAYERIRAAIDAKILDKDVAVTCHGVLSLTAEDQEDLEQLGVDLGLDDEAKKHPRSVIEAYDARAIVKNITSLNSGITSTNVDEIRRKVASLNEVGICIGDIRIQSFRDGRVVDFGHSVTDPHPLFDRDRFEEAKAGELLMFDEMVGHARLRNRGKVQEGHGMQLRSHKRKRI
ncbi:hypothetical protein FOMG_18529 [Fusarium oxysporum f. sp. melonis 26406]|uniref:Protein kinase domain-containing protein n=1 Tax=Fusarium oxysporum f. sp. melonis 26406 TaxID=1089452 RepID=W9Z822_FUSOX|nr:hypothetical protein FOMG_18529 [Fusarium oxysporum f. sp. melonis 26406]